jgi:YhcH/YjgK/YiaL family protein
MKRWQVRPNRIILISFILIISNMTQSQEKNPDSWTIKSAKKWVKSREWSNGLNLKVNSAVDNVEFARQYHANKALWDKAFAFMRDEKLEDIKPGKYPIDGDNVFASVTNSPSKEFERSAWESHRRYIDLQYVIKGKEKIGVAPLAEATVIKPYNEAKDGANYDAAGKYYIATPKEFFLFFPGDVHRPNIKVAGYDTVKKLVIKIRVNG